MKFTLLLIFLFLFVSSVCKAQLCNGNLGDPIVNVTFGNMRTPLPKSRTTFTYTGGCPSDTGSYSIQNLIFGCGDYITDHSWHPLTGDHTGDVNGQFMVANASWALGVSHEPRIIHLDTATNLCGNTTYQYAAWLANVMRNTACGGNPVLPDITFTISTLSGVTLATTNSGDLPIEFIGRVWRQYGLSFTTPATVNTVVLTLSIDPKRGCGNAFVVDDITFNMCGPLVTANIDGKPGPAEVCADYNNPFILKATYDSGFTNPAVQWQSSLDTGKTWKDIPAATSTTYKIPRRGLGVVLYRMAVAEQANINSLHCRILSNVIYTSVNPVAAHHSPENLRGCLGKKLLLPEKDPFAINIIWKGPNGYSSTLDKSIVTNVSNADTGLYTLEQHFYYGCVSLDSFYLQVYPGTTISAQTTYSLCEGNTINLSASGNGTFDWQPSTGLSNNHIANPVASPHDSIQYKVILTNSFGCKDSALVDINVFRNPRVSVGPDKTIIKGDTVILNGNIKGTAINYSWSPNTFINNNKILTPKVFPQQNTQYTLTAISTVGCGIASAGTMIKVFNDIYIPTAFTPNGDGKNDFFKIIGADGYKLIKFQVYNRWGQVAYDAKDLNVGWDGTYKKLPQPVNTYVYYVELQTTSGKKIIKTGQVILIR